MFCCTTHTQMFFQHFDEYHESALRARLVSRIVSHMTGRHSAPLENDKCSELFGQNGVGLVPVVD